MTDRSVAIIGLALQLPGARSLPQLNDMLEQKIDRIDAFPDGRKRGTVQYLKIVDPNEEQHAEYIDGAYLDSIDAFDYRFFGLSYKEARFMDPHQRLMLQNAYQAVEDAGYGGDCLRGSRTGVYIGYNANNQRYDSSFLGRQPEDGGSAFAGNLNSIIAGRIAYFLGLRGSAMVVDTACSSSLTALHLGCRGLVDQDCDLAIVGAISLKLLLLSAEEKLGTESFDYRTRTFDNQSDGTGPGEAVISVVLKRHAQAVEDRDSVYAVIKGSALNHNGGTIGITAPSITAQEEVILQAWKNAGIHPENLSFVEAHGTGTQLGDPVELAALRRAFQKYTNKRQFCAIGSVKTNLGHVESASGLLGLAKCIASLQYKTIYPSNHFELPNHRIDFHLSSLYISDTARPIQVENCICALSSFGISGTNGHMVIAAPQIAESELKGLTKVPERECLFTLSAKTMGALYRLLHSYDDFLANCDCGLVDLCYTSLIGRGHYTHRLAIIADSTEDLSAKIKNLLMDGVVEAHSGDVMFRICKPKKYPSTGEASDIRSIQSAYCSGARIPWVNPYPQHACRRVHLPIYEYDPVKCWFTEDHAGDTYDFYRATYVVRETMTPVRIDVHGVLAVLDGSEEITARQQSFFMALGHVHVTCPGEDGRSLLQVIGQEDTVTHLMLVFCDDHIHNAELLYDFLHVLGRQGIGSVRDITVVTEKSLAVLPGDAIGECHFHLQAILKAAIWEYPEITFRYWDMDDITSCDNLNELLFIHPEFISVVRQGKRYVEVMDKAGTETAKAVSYQEHGVYLVTGGAGGVGLVMADYLAQKGCVNIALVQRTCYSAMTPAVKTSISNIMRRGAHVSVWEADVEDEGQMRELLSSLRKRYARIAGAIHCATSTRGGRISDLPFHAYTKNMQAKTRGATLLHSLMACDEPDFLVLFSSAITVTGGYQSAAYIAANMFLSVFAQKMNHADQCVMAMQWPAWKNTGLAKSVDPKKELFELLEPADACRAFDAALKTGQASVVIGRVNPQSELFYFKNKLPFEFMGAATYITQSSEDSDSVVPIQNDNRISIDDLDNMLCYMKQVWFRHIECQGIALTDNFFEVGGDSISAMKIVNEINRTLHCTLTISSILGNPTIQTLSEFVFQTVMQKEYAQIDISDSLVLSPSQKRMFMHWITNPQSLIYNLPEAIAIEGRLDYDKLNDAIRVIYRDNEIFRTVYRQTDGQLHPEVTDVDYRDIDIVSLQEHQIREYILRFIRPFDLNTGPFLRTAIIKLEREDKHIFLYDVHHIAFDGVTRDLFINSILKHYYGVLDQTEHNVQYRHYAAWFTEYLQSDVVSVQKRYWLDKFVGQDMSDSNPTDLAFDENRGERLVLQIPESVCDRISDCAAKEKGTLFMFMLTVYSIIVHYFTGRRRVSISTPVAGRNNVMFQKTMGMFVNTLILRNDIDQQESFQSFFRTVIANTILDLSNQDYQYEDLVSELKISRGLRQNQLFQSMLVLQEKEFGKDFAMESLLLKAYPIPLTVVKFPYSMQIVRLEHGMVCYLDYCTNMYSKASMEGLLNQFLKIIHTVLNRPDIKICELGWVDPGKKRLSFNLPGKVL